MGSSPFSIRELSAAPDTPECPFRGQVRDDPASNNAALEWRRCRQIEQLFEQPGAIGGGVRHVTIGVFGVAVVARALACRRERDAFGMNSG